MGMCFRDKNEETKFKILAGVVGEKEAWRDFFEQNGNVRPPLVVVKKIEDLGNQPVAIDEFQEYYESLPEAIDELPVEQINNLLAANSRKESMRAVETLSKQLGIEAIIVTPQEAMEMKKSSDPGMGFFRSGKVYLVEGAFDADTIFHEFSHPLVKSLSKNNREVFESLFNEVMASDLGFHLVSGMESSSLDPASNEYKEEVIVRAMELINREVVAKPQSWLDKLFFAFRQMLRKVFKIDASKLAPTTTLKQLVTMLNQGDSFKLDYEALNADDTLMLKMESDELMKRINQAGADTAQKIINEFADMIKEQVAAAGKPNSIYSQIAEGFTNEENDGLLQNLRKITEVLSTSDKSRKAVKSLSANVRDQEINEVVTKLESIFKSIAKGEEVFKMIQEKMAILEKKDGVIEDLDALHALGQYALQWDNFLNKTLDKNALYMNLYSDNQETAFTTRMTTLAESATNLTRDIAIQKARLVSKIISDQVNKEKAPITAAYLKNLDQMRDSGNMRDYDRMHTEFYGLSPDEMLEYNRLNSATPGTLTVAQQERYTNFRFLKTQGTEVTPDTIMDMLMGLSPDAVALNNIIEGAANSQDIVVGGLHTLVRNQMNELHGIMNSNQAEMLNKINPHLKATGWDKKRHFGTNGIGSALKQVTNVGRLVNNEIEDFHDYQFMNNFKDWEKDISVLQHSIKLAADEYKNSGLDEHYDEYLRATEALEDFNRAYMHQKYVDEYYDVQKLLRGNIGREVRKRLHLFYGEMNEMQDLELPIWDHRQTDHIKNKWVELRWMSSIYNADGTEKVGREKEIAERLAEYNEKSQKFKESVRKEGVFELAYNTFVENWLDENPDHTIGSSAFEGARNSWMRKNTTVQIDEAYYEKRAALYDEKSVILKKFNELNKDIADVGDLYKQIYDLNKKSKDDQGQYDGTALSAANQIRIRDMHIEIEEATELYYRRNGLTKEEYREYRDIMIYFDTNGHQFESPTAESRYMQLKELINEGLKNAKFGITQDQVERLAEIEKELSSMRTTTATDYYAAAFVSILREKGNETGLEIFDEYVQGYGYVVGEDDIPEDVISKFLYEEEFLLDEVKASAPTFAEWFDNNHYDKEKFVLIEDEEGESRGEYRMVPEKTSLWSFTKPSDNLYYKAEPMYDAQGNIVGVFELDHTPRVPNMTFYKSVVKEEYKTEIVERDYIDNNGNLVLANIDNRNRFLPKTPQQGASSSKYINPDYQTMFDTDHDLWNMLDEFKNIHLDSQIGLDNAQKLGLSYPSARRAGLEKFTPHKPKEAARRFVSNTLQMVHSQADDYNFGLMMKPIGTKKLDEFGRPVYGTFELDLDDRSLDIIDLMMQYQQSVESFKLLRKNYSVAKTLQELLAGETIAPQINKFKKELDFVAAVSKNPNVVHRAKAVNQIFERHYEGAGLTSFGEGTIGREATRMAHRGVSGISSLSNRKFFFFNWMSDATNAVSGRVQYGLISATRSGDYFNMKNWMVGEKKASSTISQMLALTYSSSTRGVDVQLAQLMNAAPDKFEHEIGDAGSRNASKDAYEGKAGYAVRAVLQHQLELAAFYALLDNQKYRFQINGTGPLTTLDKSVELRNGKIHTKDGVPQEYSISYDSKGTLILGDKLKQIMNHHNGFLVKATGLAGKFSQSEFMNRWLLGKIMLMVLRFVPGMTMDRYQFKIRKDMPKSAMTKSGLGYSGRAIKGLFTGNIQARYNWDTKQAEIGMYVGALQFFQRTVTGRLSNVSNNEYARENLRGLFGVALTKAMQALILSMCSGMVFNDDDDDEYNDYQYDPNNPDYQSLKASATLPRLPGVDPKYAASKGMFEVGDYAQLVALRLGLRVEKETDTWNPLTLTPLVKDIILGNGPAGEGSVKDVFEIVKLLTLETKAAMGFEVQDSKLTIGADAGPYTWQREGERKIWNVTGRLFGLNGSMINPAQAIENEAAFAK